MRISVERLRVGLLVGAGLLVVVIAAFLGYARYRLHRGIMDLPGKLGATITSESNGYTYSQSDGKKTVFTIHAAKAVQHSDGKYTLHDVNMILYGHKGDRADRISGSEFEYDTKAEVVRAAGVVHIDLQAPVAQGTPEAESSKHLCASGAPAGVNEEAGAGSRVIHVTTSGLVYVKSLGTAATDQGLDFAFGGYTGHAVGAEYNSDNGHLVLQSAVTMSGLAGRKDGGKPIALAASHGELDRASNQADFNHARYSSAGEVAQAEMAHLHLRPDGTVGRIEGVGRVVLEDAGQGRATSDRADVTLDESNKPRTAVLTGNVNFNDDEALREARGDSETADLNFDEHGRIDHAVLRGNVHTSERVRAAPDPKAPWSERTLTADAVDLALVTNTAGKAELRDAKATGSARLSSRSTVAGGIVGKRPGTTIDRFAADQLQAHFLDARGIAELSTVHGAGHTVLEQIAPGSVTQTSSGETLDARFREAAGGTSPHGMGSVELAEAVQQGGVMIARTAPAKATGNGLASGEALVTQHAIARQASFDADTDRMTLTGEVRMNDPQSTLWAAKVTMDRASGDATADDGVKVTYLQTGAAEPVHVVAVRAEFNQDAGRATFYGRASGETAGSGLARMWQAGSPPPGKTAGQAGSQQAWSQQAGSQQAGSQIEAPVLVFEQESRRLTARAERSGAIGTVHAVLANTLSPKAGGAGTASKAGNGPGNESKPCTGTHPKAAPDAAAPERLKQKSPVRITSDTMVYSDEQRQAVFSGGVHVLASDGEMRAQEAMVFLTPVSNKTPRDKIPGKSGNEASAAAAPSAAAEGAGAGMLGGQVERIVAMRHIELTQPGRVATGDRLIYTAADQLYVLTGTAAAPPKVRDDRQGTTTGAMLKFHSGDENVSVLGSDEVGPPRRVHTETHTEDRSGEHTQPCAAADTQAHIDPKVKQQ